MSLLMSGAMLYSSVPEKVLDIDNPIMVKSEETIDIDGVVYPVVRRGEELVIHFTYTKYKAINEHTYRNIFCENGNLVPLTSIEKSLPVGTYEIDFGHVVVPNRASGLCYGDYLIHYELNFLKESVVSTKTELFYVPGDTVN